MGSDPHRNRQRTTGRRRFIAGSTLALTGGAALAGCLGDGDDGDAGDHGADGDGGVDDDIGDEYEHVTSEGTSWDDLPPLEGELEIYSGRTEDQILPVIEEIEDRYDDFEVSTRFESNEALISLIDEEGQNSPADLLYTQDSGSLGALKERGRTVELTEDVLEIVPENWRDPDGTWVGVSGRVMSVLYNTDNYDADDLPVDIFEYPQDERFEDDMAWRVDSGSFLSFIRAMMIEHGEDTTREFIEDMEASGITNHEGGSTTPEAVAAGEVSIGFTNHYYGGRTLDDQPEAPMAVHFTENDLGSLFNVSGVAVLDSSDERDLARNFTRHLLSTEGQEFFVETNREYAVIPGVEYGFDAVPPIDEIEYPEFDLNQLSDVEPAVDLLREVGYR